MFERTRPVRDPVTIHADGRAIVAERGEPLAVALLAAGETVLARSPKLHRPRGPSCLRGDCDGCIARVDGVPNVMTCLRDTRGGETVATQNVLGGKKTDLLRITDWFFPKGIDHHHLMAGVPGVGAAMQTFARQMAGIGRLPDEPVEPRLATISTCDVLVAGAGLAGLSAARVLAESGASVDVVDEGPTRGGSARFADDARDLLAGGEAGGAKVHARASVLGVYDGQVLVASDAGARLVRPRALLVATGAHDGVLLSEGNDLPGVLSARAVCALASSGVLPSRGAVIVGDGPWARRAAAALGDRVRAKLAETEIAAVRGRTRVKSVRTKDGRSIPCGVVAVETAAAPSFAIAAQAGARTRAGAGGFAVLVDERGNAAEGVYAAGECTGAAFDPLALVAEGAAVGRAIAADLGLQPSMTESKSPSPPAVKTTPNRPSKVK